MNSFLSQIGGINMKRDIYISIILSIVTFVLFFIGLYGTLFREDGFFLVFGQIISMYLLIFHPLIFFLLSRRLLREADIRYVPENLIFNIIVLPLFPIAYVLIPIGVNIIDNFSDLSALEFVFIIFEFSAVATGFAFFVRYARKTVLDTIVPRDLYAIHHYYIGSLVYFYFVRLTILSSLLLSGASGI